MRHLNRGRKLNRTSAHRKALFRNLVLSLIQHERIKTTDAKAKELRRYADRMVTLGKRGDLAARRLAFAFMQSRDAVKKLFDEIAPRFKDSAGRLYAGGQIWRPPRRCGAYLDYRIHRYFRSSARDQEAAEETAARRDSRRANAAAGVAPPPADEFARRMATMP